MGFKDAIVASRIFENSLIIHKEKKKNKRNLINERLYI